MDSKLYEDVSLSPITVVSPNKQMELKTNITHLKRGYRLWYCWRKVPSSPKEKEDEEGEKWFTNTDYGFNYGTHNGTYGYIRAKWSDDNKYIVFTFHDAYSGDDEKLCLLSVKLAFDEGKAVKFEEI